MWATRGGNPPLARELALDGIEQRRTLTTDLASASAQSKLALVAAGFRLALQPARVAGLVVAGLAVLKVVLFDLSSLDALYRVGSVFLLALVALSLAYLYYRYDRSERI